MKEGWFFVVILTQEWVARIRIKSFHRYFLMISDPNPAI